MMRITIVAAGRLKERFWEQAAAEYLKRLGGYAHVDVREVADVDPAHAGGEAKALEREGSSIVAAIPNGAVVILLDVGGKPITSEGIASKLDNFALSGTSNVCFVIGSSCGVSPQVRALAQERWSLGGITLPHNLARIVLLEQIYRAFKIIRKEPYHK